MTSLDDVRQENEDLYDRIPAFVPWAIGGTALWFTSFTFVSSSTFQPPFSIRIVSQPPVRQVQWRYQYIGPDNC